MNYPKIGIRPTIDGREGGVIWLCIDNAIRPVCFHKPVNKE